jgi:hypothetical protein
VESLDLEELGFTHAVPNDLGRPPYNPADLLRLFVYSYLNRVRSSRQLEREANRNVELMWLLRRLAPDFKTDLHHAHRSSLSAMARQELQGLARSRLGSSSHRFAILTRPRACLAQRARTSSHYSLT